MGGVYYLCPSKRHPAEAEKYLHRWIDQGYKVLVQRDPGEPISVAHVQREYLGYAEAVNNLVACAMTIPGSQWYVIGGDDILPDPNKDADEIAMECEQYFFGDVSDRRISRSTFGVMQPTGDRWGECPDAHDFKARPHQPHVCTCGRGRDCDQHLKGAYIDRVAGSPWIGREFARRINQGKGPLWPEYFHMFEDQELMEVATKLGVFWQRRDIVQHHQHWGRPKPGQKYGQAENMPAFLQKANSGEMWKLSRELFESRKARGFPGSEPIE